MRYSEYPPKFLAAQDYEEIRTRMLVPAYDMKVPSAACEVLSDNELGICAFEVVDQTFSGQINDVYYNHASLGSNLVSPPDAYLVTVKSALPIADSVRGFYQELGLEQPIIETIYSNGRVSRYFYRGEAEAEFEAEAKLIGKFMADAAHVCVIDQFVNTGRTLSYAGAILNRAGVCNISAIRGDWYDDAEPLDLDYDNVTSIHKDFMSSIGRQAAKMAKAA